MIEGEEAVDHFDAGIAAEAKALDGIVVLPTESSTSYPDSEESGERRRDPDSFKTVEMNRPESARFGKISPRFPDTPSPL